MESSPEPDGKREKIKSFLRDGWSKGKDKATDELIKSKIALQHSIGLGAKPNVIPPGEARVDGDLRPVEIGWHPVPGAKWLADQYLGKMITKNVGKFPDPTQHWAVLVGDYVHQLWMDEDLNVIYINEVLEDRSIWQTFEVGHTRFTDEALRQAAEMVIHNMRATRPAYNVISNNCQNYAVLLLDAIQVGAHIQFATSFAVYQAATGEGSIKELFAEKPQDPVEQDMEAGGRIETLQNAQQVMDEHTTKLDDHRSLF